MTQDELETQDNSCQLSILQGDSSMLHFFETMNHFECVSGALVNPDKPYGLELTLAEKISPLVLNGLTSASKF